MDRGAWWTSVHGIAENQTRLSDTFTFFHETWVKSHEGQQAIFAQLISPHVGLILSVSFSLNNAY